MKNYRKLICVLFLLPALTVSAQCRYCMSFEDFMEGRWETVDSVEVVPCSKGHKFMWGGNDYAIKGTDKASCKMLRKKAFAVVAGHKLYVNCLNLKYNRAIFGKGFALALPLGSRGLIFAATDADPSNAAMAGALFGAVGGAIAAASQLSNQVCYIISKGSDGKRYIEASLVDDRFISNLLLKHTDLLDEYYSETDSSKRIRAGRIFPLLEKSGYVEDLE